MGWFRDLLSPSNLWTAFQFCFPAAAAAVSAKASLIWDSSPSVAVMVALMTACCVVILMDFARSWFDRRNNLVQRVAELEEILRPKIKVIGITCPVTDYSTFERTIHIEIENDSGAILDNCLAQITRMGGLKSFGPENEVSEWEPKIFEEHLPLTLKTEKNYKRNGSSPFNLRAKQRKKLPLCTRQDGERTGMTFVSEDGETFTIDSATSCDLEVTLLGSPEPTIVKINIRVNDRGEPVVKHHA